MNTEEKVVKIIDGDTGVAHQASVSTKGAKEAIAVEIVDDEGNQITTFGSTNYTKIIDTTTTPNVIYIGYTTMGNVENTDQAIWAIKKLDTTSGVVTTWADGNDNLDNVFDDRATTITYS